MRSYLKIIIAFAVGAVLGALVTDSILLHQALGRIERTLARRETVAAPRPSPDEIVIVEMSEPYDPAWDEDDIDDRSAYQRGKDEAKKPVLTIPVDVMYRKLQPEKDAPGDWVRTSLQGCMLARMGASEDTRPLRRVRGGGTEGELTQDHHGIAAVVRNNKGRLLLRRHRLRGKVQSWAHVMGELSPHVNQIVDLQEGKPRQVWTSSLPCAGDAMPDGWEDDNQAGDWEIARQFWPKFRDKMVALWMSDGFDHVPGLPIGWGSMTGDIPKALARGMVLVPWGDGRNGFIRWPTDDERRLVVATGPPVP